MTSVPFSSTSATVGKPSSAMIHVSDSATYGAPFSMQLRCFRPMTDPPFRGDVLTKLGFTV
jgi:hypothetical protein